jgi:hypothetical protein
MEGEPDRTREKDFLYLATSRFLLNEWPAEGEPIDFPPSFIYKWFLIEK